MRGVAARYRRLDESSRRRFQRWLLWIGLLLVAFVPPFFSQAGRYAADTKLPVWFAPTRYLINSLKVWQSSPYLGHEQHDGLLFPMATFVAIFRGIGLPVWAVERLWHGLLLFTSATGMVLLVDLFNGKRVTIAQPLAAAVYAFNPYTLAFGLHGSGVFIPYALLPMLLVVWIRGLREPKGWLWPAVVALVFFGMGGGNGAPQVYALIPLAAFLLWAVFVERSVRAGQAALFAAKAGALAVVINLYWLVGLTTQGVANDIAFSEQPKVINLTSSFAESLRLLGFWGFYGSDRFGPWYPTLRRFFTSPVFVLSSFLVPVLAFAAAWRSRWRTRLLFVLLAVLAVVVMAGTYPVTRSTPFGQALLHAYSSIPGASGLRTTYKFGSTLALSIALLAGIGAAEAWGWLRARAAWRPVALIAAMVLVASVVLNAYPLWTGDLYQHSRTTKAIPGYWRQAEADLQKAVKNHRVFFAPGGLFAYYSWGGPLGGIAEAYPQLPSVRRPALPIMQRYGSDLLAATEQPYQLGPSVPGATAALLRRMGVAFVVLQNDLDFARSNTARPTDLQILAHEPGLQPEASFGEPGENVPGSGSLSQRDRNLAKAEKKLPPVQIFRVSDPLPVIRAESGSPLIVSGDAFGLSPVLSSGLLGSDQPVLYSGNLSAAGLQALAADGPEFVVTDSNRRRTWDFSAVRQDFSYTLPADQGGRAVGYNLFGGRVDTQTVAIASTGTNGSAHISASGYGSPFAPEPWLKPENVFDDNPSTIWGVNGFNSPIGQWVQISFDHPISVSRLTLDPYVGRRGSRQLTGIQLMFSDGSVVSRRVAPGLTVISFGQRTTRSIRLQISNVRPGPFGGLIGLKDITIPGLTVNQALRLPTDLFDAIRGNPSLQSLLSAAPLAYVFDRGRSNGSLPDEETGLDRIFQVPASRGFDLAAVVRLDPRVPDQEVDRLLLGTTSVVATSSGRAHNNIGNRASLAIDGDPATGWTSNGTRGQWIQVSFPAKRLDHLSLLGFVDARHSALREVQIELSDGTKLIRPVATDGKLTVHFPAKTVSSVKVTVLAAGLPTSLVPIPPPAGIRELTIPGVKLTGFPSARTPLGCYEGPGVELDGRPVSVRLGTGTTQLLTGGRFQISACDSGALSLAAGQHELRISGVLQPVTASLRSGFTTTAATAPSTPSTAVKATPAGYRVDVKGATAPFYLVLGQNVSTAWQASIGGISLGPSLVLDGFSAGWRVARTGDFTIQVTYAAQARQNLAFAVSGLGLPLVVLVASFGWRRRRRRRTIA